MKFLWFLLLAVSALLFIQATQAENENYQTVAKTLEEPQLPAIADELENAPVKVNEEVSENLKNEQEENEDPAQELIAADDIKAFKDQPEMERLARSLRAFHNDNVLNNYRNLDKDDLEEDDGIVPEDRAIRRRTRVRRRKTKNKVKRTNRNKHVAKRRRSSNSRSKNKNSLRRKSNRKSNAKKTRRRSSSPKRSSTRRRSSKRSGLRRRSSGKRKRTYQYDKRGFNTRSGKKRRRTSKKKKHSKKTRKSQESMNDNDKKDTEEQQEQEEMANVENAAAPSAATDGQPAENAAEPTAE